MHHRYVPVVYIIYVIYGYTAFRLQKLKYESHTNLPHTATYKATSMQLECSVSIVHS